MSLNAAAIAVMVERGLTAADILAVAVALEIKADPTAAERKRRQRAREADERDLSRVTSQCDIAPPPSPPLKVSPDPFKKTPPISPTPTTPMRARRLPDDWKPEPLVGKAAVMVDAWQPGELERELAKFRNYWRAKGGKDACKVDWQRTLINWLISADERKPRHGGQPTNGVGVTERAMQRALASIEGSQAGASQSA